jgi:hypothetical protein
MNALTPGAGDFVIPVIELEMEGLDRLGLLDVVPLLQRTSVINARCSIARYGEKHTLKRQLCSQRPNIYILTAVSHKPGKWVLSCRTTYELISFG